MLDRRSLYGLLFFPLSTGVFATEPLGTDNATIDQKPDSELSKELSSLRLAGLTGIIPPIDEKPENTAEFTEHISLVLVGDTGYAPSRTTPHSTGVAKYGAWQTWAQTTSEIRSQINGDINFANMESVVSKNGRLRAWPKKFNFMTHPFGVDHLADIGFNLFSMANNHSFDYGAAGVRDSVKHMNELAERSNVIHAGIGLNRAQAAQTPVFEVKNTRFAFGSIGIGASSGGLPRATAKRPGQLNLYNKKDLGLLTDNLAESNADYRILSVHRGVERNIRASRDEISRIRHTMLEQGNVDLLIGHHAHVTRGVELNNGKLVFYGLGNFLHQGTANMARGGRCRDYSIVARVHLTKQQNQKPKLAAVEVIPITATHMRPKPMSANDGARRIAILNGLASQFDDQRAQAKGIRFAIRKDGSGLYCTPVAAGDETTARLCEGYQPHRQNHAKIFKAALNTCGSSFGPKVFTKLQSDAESPESTELAALLPKPKSVSKAQSDTRGTEVDKQPRQKIAVSKPSKKRKKLATKKRSKRVKKSIAQKATYRSKKRISNKRLAKMSRAQRKRYWTRYWYIKRGRKVPKHLR